MFKHALAIALAVSGVAGPSSGAFAGTESKAQPRACSTLFASNKTTIEALAEAGNTAGIKALFAKAGCAEPQVDIGARPPTAGRAQNAKITCEATLLPPRIRCTFGMATRLPNAS